MYSGTLQAVEKSEEPAVHTEAVGEAETDPVGRIQAVREGDGPFALPDLGRDH